MSDTPTPKISCCCTCGYEWTTGTDGWHSCAHRLSRDLATEKAKVAELESKIASLQPLMRSKAEKDNALLRDALHRANVAVAHHMLVENSSAITPELQASIQAALDATK